MATPRRYEVIVSKNGQVAHTEVVTARYRGDAENEVMDRYLRSTGISMFDESLDAEVRELAD